MPTATMLASSLRLKPGSAVIGRKNGPMPRRMPTDSSVRQAAAATMFQPKYQRGVGRLIMAATVAPRSGPRSGSRTDATPLPSAARRQRGAHRPHSTLLSTEAAIS